MSMLLLPIPGCYRGRAASHHGEEEPSGGTVRKRMGRRECCVVNETPQSNAVISAVSAVSREPTPWTLLASDNSDVPPLLCGEAITTDNRGEATAYSIDNRSALRFDGISKGRF